MSGSSPSLLNSLRRFRCEKKHQLRHDNASLPSPENNMQQTQEESMDPTDSDYGSAFGSSGEAVDNSEDSIIKPVVININTKNRINSDSSIGGTNELNTQNAIQKMWNKLKMNDRLNSVSGSVSSADIVKVESTAHSISDSDSEGEENGRGVLSGSRSAGVDDDDDDDVVIVSGERSRIPKPIVLSDDDDDDESPNIASNIQEYENQRTAPKQEPEIFIVDDDSNSVELVQPEVQQEIKTQSPTKAVNGKRKNSSTIESRPKARKKKKRAYSDSEEENIQGERVFDSDADSDEEISGYLTESKKKVIEFLNMATDSELRLIPSCTAKKIEAIMTARPFEEGWIHLVNTFQTNKFLNTNLLNGAQQVIEAREMVSHLMRKCERIANRIENTINGVTYSITAQPSILNPELKLMPYQMVGLNWLNVMNSQNLSGILADEMGLGKTIQVIAFLAHLKETGQTQPNHPHLIVVPASTLDNWCIELEKWCPSLRVEQYYGSPDDRKWLRHTWIKNGFEDVDIVLTTYNMVASCYEERKMFRVVKIHYVIFDEAHMLKNMNSQRYEHLISINALHKVLLTGTPLQNNLLELMSLLLFIMPDLFSSKNDYLKFLFSKNSKQNLEEAPLFEQEQVQRAKRIMHPFVLRRLKTDVLKDLPTKSSRVVECPLEEDQAAKYAEICDQARNNEGYKISAMTLMMDLRRMANHPLTLRYHFQDETLDKIAELLASEPTYKETDAKRIIEDINWMSDHQLHKLVNTYDCLRGYELADSLLVSSGKCQMLDEILPPLKANGHRVLVFSQFVFMLDILEDYMRVRDHNFLRLDGSTPVTERQDMINQYNEDPSMFVFLLSTKAGGIGINLTAADTVIIHDVDFNPYNDKQAEDRCHRMGQTRPVQIMRFVSKGTIEEAIMRIAQEKLHLEKEVTSYKEDEVADNVNVAQLLRETLGIGEAS